MPAKSKAQQKLFALVHLYQQGKIPADKVSEKIKKIAKHITPDEARRYAATPTSTLKDVVESPAYIAETLQEIIEKKRPDYVKGQLIDNYTAALLQTVLNNLHESNQQVFLSKSINEMVALAYTMVTS